MKVALAQPPTSSSSRTRGIGAYTRELMEALQKQFPEHEYQAVTGNPYRTGATIVHYPYFDPFFLTLPLHKPLPTVVTVHDAIPLKYPKHFPPGFKGNLKWGLQRLSAKGASMFITDSEASKRDIVDYFGVKNKQIQVIPLSSATPRTTTTISSKVKAEYHLPARYILYVGDINWNKNVAGLINAFGRLGKTRTHLVLVGKVFADKPDIPEYQVVMEALESSGAKDRIHILGYVPSHHLATIYRLASLYVQPSFDEGFGLTLLEAMKAGVPVLASSRGSLPEVGGEAVSYFDPVEDDLTKSLQTLLADKNLRDKLIEQGLARSKLFTWQQTAVLTQGVYDQVVH